jgi:hypothetical protein
VILIHKLQAFPVPSTITNLSTCILDADLLVSVVEDTFELLLTVSSYVPMTITIILVNNMLLNKFFAMLADCEYVVYLLKLASMLGAFNIFAIVQGGSMTGQADAIMHSIVQDIITHISEVDTIL